MLSLVLGPRKIQKQLDLESRSLTTNDLMRSDPRITPLFRGSKKRLENLANICNIGGVANDTLQNSAILRTPFDDPGLERF